MKHNYFGKIFSCVILGLIMTSITSCGGGSTNQTPNTNNIIPSNTWTWMKGESLSSAVGVYGIIGIESSGVTPGGLANAIGATDASGNFWLFGGGNTSNGDSVNALWKFNISTNNWTWMKGESTPNESGVYGIIEVESSGNTPGSRFSHNGWIDESKQNIWIFGGQNLDMDFSDLWKFNISTNNWTWMKGESTPNTSGVYGTMGIEESNTYPGTRMLSATWIDESNNLWMFGGYGRTQNGGIGDLNDLWKFNISTNNWTWVKGESAPSSGVTTITTLGGRQKPGTWIDESKQNLFLFGGYNQPSNSYFNDLWKYNISTNTWQFIKGPVNPDNTTISSNTSGVYGIMGQESSGVIPGSRYNAVTWTDSNHDFWLFGGYGTTLNGGTGDFNDLWKYNISTNNWTWIKGESTINGSGIYGTLGQPDLLNNPNSLYGGVGYVDQAGNYWLFGGSNNNGGLINTLWKYIP